MGSRPEAPPDAVPRFLSVGVVARIFDISEVTVYREIRAGRFPAVKIRGRYVIPARAIVAMEAAAVDSGALVDAADWLPLRAMASPAAADQEDHRSATPRRRLAAALTDRAEATA